MKTKFDHFLLETDVVFDSQFTTPITDIDIENIEAVVPYDSYNIYTTPSTATVIWSLDPDMRDSGIKSMGLMVLSVSLSIEWKYDDGEGEAEEGVIELSKKSIDSDWQIIDNVKFGEDGSVFPNHLEIDFKEKKITVS